MTMARITGLRLSPGCGSRDNEATRYFLTRSRRILSAIARQKAELAENGWQKGRTVGGCWGAYDWWQLEIAPKFARQSLRLSESLPKAAKLITAAIDQLQQP